MHFKWRGKLHAEKIFAFLSQELIGQSAEYSVLQGVWALKEIPHLVIIEGVSP